LPKSGKAMGTSDLKRILEKNMNFSLDRIGLRFPFFTLALALSLGVVAQAQQNAAQTAPSPAAATTPTAITTEDVGPVAEQLAQTLSAINVTKWKAPNEVKGQAQGDLTSIQRNLRATLPGLLDQAKAAPNTVAPAFAIYRNLGAVYDVLLRVSETATLAAPPQEAAALDNELRRLEGARKTLGNQIFDAASARDTEVVRLRASSAQLASQLAAAQAPAKKVVVSDGPSATTKKRKKKPAATASPAPPPTY